MISPSTCIEILWAAWLAGWFLAAGSTASTVKEQSPASRFGHSVFIWAGAALFLVRSGTSAMLNRALYADTDWISWLGVVLVAGGLAYAALARVHLGRLWSAGVTLKADHAIVRTGPYRLTRHPIYTGLLLALIGTVLTRDMIGPLAGLLFVTVGVTLKIRQEEELMLDTFGDAYRAYQREVPALIPGLPTS